MIEYGLYILQRRAVKSAVLASKFVRAFVTLTPLPERSIAVKSVPSYRQYNSGLHGPRVSICQDYKCQSDSGVLLCHVCSTWSTLSPVTRVTRRMRAVRLNAIVLCTWPINLSLSLCRTSFKASKHCLQCFDAVGWAAGRASGR